MDSTDLQPREPRRHTSSMALLAAGSLTGLVLGFGGMAFAETPAVSDTGSSSAQQTATTDREAAAQQDAAVTDGAAADELCDEPGGPGADDGTADDSTADGTASTTSAAA